MNKVPDGARINPNPKIVALINYAIAQVNARLSSREEFSLWLSWAKHWADGERSPASCVETAHRCFEHKGYPTWHCLGQLAWAAKESCYDTPKSGWLVVRYVADAMIAFGAAFPTDNTLLESPSIVEVVSPQETEPK
jgi:hypothetical protein